MPPAKRAFFTLRDDIDGERLVLYGSSCAVKLEGSIGSVPRAAADDAARRVEAERYRAREPGIAARKLRSSSEQMQEHPSSA